LEEPIQFSSEGKSLYGILHLPDSSTSPSCIVIILTGGPQVRTGSHRLYVQLSRFLSSHNITALRFDYEGMGDSDGNYVGFEHAGPSITAALDFLNESFSKEVRVVIWSLCDGASASILYAADKPKQIAGLILSNPLVITDEGLARSTLKHYYIKRFLEKSFWVKLLSFRIYMGYTIKSLIDYTKKAGYFSKSLHNQADLDEKMLPYRVLDGLIKCKKPIRCILSTDDIVAANFLDVIKKSKKIKKLYTGEKIRNYFIKGADHTFTDPEVKKELFETTLKAFYEIEAAAALKQS